MNKIDPNIFSNIKALSKNDNVECIVYAHNYHIAKRYISNLVDKNSIIDFPFMGAFAITTNCKSICNIAGLECVKYVSSVASVSTCIDKSNDFLGTNNLVVTNTKNISVAVIDTGCSPHIDLMMPKKIIKFIDLVNDKKYMYDDNGHGTFVTGVLCGSGAYSGGKFAGIDKDINVISIKALDKNGETGAVNILKAMQWIYDNKSEYNIKVVCMSFGATPLNSGDPLIRGAEILWDSGVVVVCAAGNSGPDEKTIKSPGASSKIITVGALDLDNNQVANFSSRGPGLNSYKPDLIVPGVNVKGLNYKLTDYPYTIMSGTSVATPMVAGICSNIVKMSGKISPNRVKSMLIQRCTQINGDKNSEGFGYYDKNKS
ncbi:MAG: S8 family serine peptidase [Clostridia bacterium]|nr:S8 family serine peptidase [Clostridia bacterium]